VVLVNTATTTASTPVDLSTTTASDGSYSFANLAAGNYTITETQPTNYIEGKDEVGSQSSGTIAQTAKTNAVQNITLAADVNGINNDFGNLGLTMAYVSKRGFLDPSTPVNLTTVDSLSITKVDNAGGSSITNTPGNVTPSQSLTYTVVVTNTGTAAETGVTIADPVPSNFTGDTWTASAVGGATGFSATGTGNIDNTNVSLPVGSSIKYVVTGTISSTAMGTVTNTATVTPPGGTAIPATDTDNLPTLTVTKVDNAGGSSITPSTGNVTPGQLLTYTVIVSNTGPGNATGVTITDPIPANVTGDTWTAASTGSATAIGFATSGSGNINQTGVNLPAGSAITYTITGTVNSAATGTLSNTATVTPPTGSAKTATDNDNLTNLSITKVDNAGGSSITPSTGNVLQGQSLTYTVVVSNSGPGNVTGATITDPIPPGLTGDAWTAASTGSATATGFATSGTGNINQTGVNLPAGSAITYTITGTVSSTATGTLSNTATVTPPSGTSKSATDTDNLPNLSITKVDNAGGSSITPSTGNVTPGQSLTYTVVVRNTGPGNETGATITDPIPADITGDTWTAASTGSATATGFATSGTGNINQTGVNLPAGSAITYTITGTVSSAATGTMTNTATVAPPIGTPKTATDTDNLAELSITKVDNAGGSSITPSTGTVTDGQTLTYTIVVSNAGPGNVTGATITDPIPSELTGDTWTATSTGSVPATGFAASGSGNINQTGVNLPAGSAITYFVTGTLVTPDTNLPVTSISNTATVTSSGVSKTATDTDGLADLAITKVDNAGGSSISDTIGNVTPGQTLTYTVVVSNPGPGNATNVTITDPIPADFTGDTWTAASTGSATATGFATSGSGNVSQTGVNLPAGSSITYTITGTVNPTATGTLSNTASVTPPGGTAKIATDVDNLADLSITKVDNAGGSSITPSTGNVTPGQSLTYTVVVSNSGPGNVTGATITDPIPADLTGDTWTAASTGSATATGFATSGSGNINQTGVNLPAGSAITYTITGTVDPAATDTMTNTATVTPPAGTALTATDNDNLADLSITKVDNAGGSSITSTTGNVLQGQSLTYTVVVSNSGPGNVTGATITDPIPADLTGDTWTAASTGSATASGFATSGSGNINQTGANLPAGSAITYTITGTVSSAATGILSNTATVTPPSGTSQTATDTDNLPNLSIVKFDNAGGSSITATTGNVLQGQSLTYKVIVSNTGPGNETGATITDPIPADLTGDTWTAASTGSATASGFATSGSGNINQSGVNLPADSAITYTISGTVSSTATGTLTNTATVTPPIGASKSATDTDNLADLSITKVDNAGGSSITPSTGNVTPGQSLTYTVVVSNTGPGNITGATITDPIPADITGDTWTAASTGSATATGFATSGSGSINQSGVSLPADSAITYTITGTVSSAATGTFSNTATVTPPIGTAKSATDSDNLPFLSIAKTDNAGGSSSTLSIGNVTNGQTLTYTITIGNSGPGSVTGVSVSDPLPSELTNANYTTTLNGGATDTTPSGTGVTTITDTVSLPAGSSIVYTVTGTLDIPTNTNLSINSISNTVSETPTGGITQTATDFDNVIRLGISKVDNVGGSSSADTTGSISPGESLTYTVVVSNNSTGTATGVTIADPVPADFTADTWTATSTTVPAATGFSATGSGNIDDTSVTMPPGSSITYTVTGTVSSTATSGSTLTNTATVTPSGGTPVSATDNDTVGTPDLTITKVDNAGGSSITPTTGNVIPGQSLTYTVVVSNTGTGGVTGASVTDPLPSTFDSGSYTTTFTGGATDLDPIGIGVTNLSDTVNLPGGSSITYTINGTINSTAVGQLNNTATLTPTVGSPVSATDTDNLTGLEIIKSDDAGGTSNLQTGTSSPAGTTGSSTDDDSLTYTVVVSNVGPGFVNGATITDPFPAGYAESSWTSVVSGAATGNTSNSTPGTNIDDTVDLPSGSSITYTINGTIVTTPTLTNTATVTPPVGTAISATDNDNVAQVQNQVVPLNRIPAVSSAIAAVGISAAGGSTTHPAATLNAAAVDVALTGTGRHTWQSPHPNSEHYNYPAVLTDTALLSLNEQLLGPFEWKV
jgi:uncharacterized repeat protein (TIGR01451 family)